MTFKVVFDAASQGYSAWPQVATSVLMIGVGLLLVLAPDLMQRVMPRGLQGTARRVFSWFFLAASLILSLIGLGGAYESDRTAASALRDGRYKIVEGRVTNFVPMPYSGHALESFEVGGRKFSYSDYILTPGFRNTASHGGPIREGLDVRISYVGNLILRLEVAQ